MKLHNADLVRLLGINLVLTRNKLKKKRDYSSAPPTTRKFQIIRKSIPKKHPIVFGHL